MKTRVKYRVLVWSLMLTTTAYPDPLSPTGTAPAIDGTVVVWADGGAIYWDDLADPNAPAAIAPVTTKPGYPAVSGAVIIWEAGSTTSTKTLEGWDLDVAGYLDFGFAEVQKRRFPAVSGDLVVWQDYTSGNADIVMLDLADPAAVPQVLCDQSDSQLYPAIDGQTVVWMDARGSVYQIYMCDVSQSPYQPEPVSPSAYPQLFPAVCGDCVVWAEDRGDPTGFDIYARCLGGATVAICTDPGDQNQPAISTELIAWQDDNTPGGEKDIRVYDRRTGQIQTACGDAGSQMYPAVSGRTVVWQNGTAGIGVATLAEPTDITLTAPEPNDMVLVGRPTPIAWTVEGPIEQVRIQIRPDAATPWTVLEPNVPADRPYAWTPQAAEIAETCQLRVSNVANAEIADVLAGTITVFACEASLTADVTGDCFVDLADLAAVAAQWLTCGNPYDAAWCRNR